MVEILDSNHEDWEECFSFEIFCSAIKTILVPISEYYWIFFFYAEWKSLFFCQIVNFFVAASIS